jgi:hypothetical protein
VRVEKLLDEAAKAVADVPPAKTTSSAPASVPDSFAAATQGNAPAAARKN